MSKMGRRPQREPRGYLVDELPRWREGPEVGAPGARSKGRKETSVARVEEAGEGREMRVQRCGGWERDDRGTPRRPLSGPWLLLGVRRASEDLGLRRCLIKSPA